MQAILTPLCNPFAAVRAHHGERNSNRTMIMQQSAAVLSRFNDANQMLLDQYISSARETLRALAATPDLLDSIKPERTPGGFTRNLVFGGQQLSVWAMVWAPGAATPIHDHHCSCCFTVLQGTIREVWFKAIDGDRVLKTAEHCRTPGYIAAMLPSGPNIHQMLNDGSEEAVSLHIYGYDHRLRSSSIHREYRRVET